MKVSPQLEKDAREAERLYGDIMHMDPPEPDPKKHPRLSMEQRAAQFLPFSALKGYDEAVEEEARITFNRPELDEDEKQILDEKLSEILYRMQNRDAGSNMTVSISYFRQDDQKDGGEICTVSGEIIKVDGEENLILLGNGIHIAIHDIIGIDFR